MKIRSSIVCILVALLVCRGLLPAHAQTTESGGPRQGRVTVGHLNVREGPDTDEPVLRAIPRDEQVTILRRSAGWLEVRLSDGLTGWVAAAYIEQLDPSTPSAKPVVPETRAVAPVPPAPVTTDAWGQRLELGRTLLKWGSLVAAVGTGYAAYAKHNKADDAYAEYARLIKEGILTPAQAEPRRQEAVAADNRARSLAFAAGLLLSAFLVQQFWIASPDDDAQAARGAPAAQLSWNPDVGQLRATLLSARF